MLPGAFLLRLADRQLLMLPYEPPRRTSGARRFRRPRFTRTTKSRNVQGPKQKFHASAAGIGQNGKKAEGLRCPSRNHDTETGGAEEEEHNIKAAVS